MKIVVSIILGIIVAQATTLSPKEKFEKYKKTYNKKYGCPEEEKVRFFIFQKYFEVLEELLDKSVYEPLESALFADRLIKKHDSYIEGLRSADRVTSELAFLQAKKTLSQPPLKEFAKFKTDYNKTYECQGLEQLRFKIFEINLKNIEEHNATNSTYKLGINKYSDLLSQEVPKGWKPPPKNQQR